MSNELALVEIILHLALVLILLSIVIDKMNGK